jgi:hypothetical protein
MSFIFIYLFIFVQILFFLHILTNSVLNECVSNDFWETRGSPVFTPSNTQCEFMIAFFSSNESLKNHHFKTQSLSLTLSLSLLHNYYINASPSHCSHNFKWWSIAITLLGRSCWRSRARANVDLSSISFCTCSTFPTWFSHHLSI